MGKAVAIAEGTVAITRAVLEVAEEIKAAFPDRSVVIEVWNHTDHELRLQSHEHTSGTFGELPSQRIAPRTVDVYGSRRRGRPEGAAGSVTYVVLGNDARWTVGWRLCWRSWRSRSSSSRLRGSDALAFEGGDLIGGSTTQGRARFELFVREQAPIVVEGRGGADGSVDVRPPGPGTRLVH
jgi:hypothetical protein